MIKYILSSINIFIFFLIYFSDDSYFKNPNSDIEKINKDHYHKRQKCKYILK
jgi:hypothetical protein